MTRRLRDLFIEPLPAGTPMAPTPAGAGAAIDREATDPVAPASVERFERAAPATDPAPSVARPRVGARSVAVLAAPGRVQHATAAVAMGLARTCGSRWTLVGVVGAPVPGTTSSSPLPAARGAAARLRRAGRTAVAVGRLVWVADEAEPNDVSGESDDSSGSLPRLADAFGVPAALGVALPRTAELDRALAEYDGLVVVREPDATVELEPLVLESLAALGPPVTALPAPSRVAAQLAVSGMHAPATALAAVRELVEAAA